MQLLFRQEECNWSGSNHVLERSGMQHTHGPGIGLPQCRQRVSDRAVIEPQAGHMVCDPYSATSMAEFNFLPRIL